MKSAANSLDRRRLLQLSGAGAVVAGAGIAAARAQAQPAGAQPFIILSCDGGGVRGVITALLLNDLDPEFLQQVSLFAGTSTGSIIALALAAGRSIEEILHLYRSMTDCRQIFTPYLSFEEASALRAQMRAALSALPPPTTSAGSNWGQVKDWMSRAIAELLYPKYASSGLQKLLPQHLPGWTLAQLLSMTKKYVVVPSFQINNGTTAGGKWRPVLFHNLPGGLPGYPDLSNTSLVDTALCSTAAPTFFPPHQLTNIGTFVDGGLAANNPCAAAIAAALGSSLGVQGGLTPEGIAAVSIGTGDIANSYPPPDSDFPYGILGWMYPYADSPAPALPLIQAMFAGSSGVDNTIAGGLLRRSTYIRVNPLFDTTWSLDDCAAIDQMVELTLSYIRTKEWISYKNRINELVGS